MAKPKKSEEQSQSRADEIRLTKTLQSLLDIAVQGRRELAREWEEHFREYLGPEQRLGFWARIRRQGRRARTKTNFLFSLMETVKPILSNEMPSIVLKPVIDTEAWQIIAEELFTKAINRIFERSDLRRVNLEVITNGLFFGIGNYKTTWDAERMNGNGDITIKSVDTRTVYLEPGKMTVPECNWFAEVTEVDQMTMMRRFPERGDDIRKLFGGTSETLENESIATQRERVSGPAASAPGAPVNTTTTRFFDIAQDMLSKERNSYPTVRLVEMWFRDEEMVDEVVDLEIIDMKTGKKTVTKNKKVQKNKFPNGRYVQYAGSFVFEDKKNEFPGFPYIMYRNYFVPGRQYAMSELKQAVPIQRQYDIRNNQLYDNMNFNMHPQRFYDAKSGLDPKTITNAPGAWTYVNDVNGIKTEDPPRLSQAAFESLIKIRQEIETVVGVREVTQGTIPGDIRSGNAIELLQEAADVRLRGKSRELESSIKEMARYLIKMVNEFYIAGVHFRIDRTVDGPNGTKIPIEETEEWKLIEKRKITPDFFDVVVRAGVNLPRSRVARQQRVKDLFTDGVVDAEYMVDQLQLDGMEQLQIRMKPTWTAMREAQLAEIEARKQQAIQGPPDQQGAPVG